LVWFVLKKLYATGKNLRKTKNNKLAANVQPKEGRLHPQILLLELREKKFVFRKPKHSNRKLWVD
jgi:hypothetical protein